MPLAIFERKTGRLRGWYRWPSGGLPQVEPNTEVMVTVPGPMDERTQRWDGTDGVRPATQQEMDELEAEERAAEFDGQKLLKALAIWTAGKMDISASAAKAEILSIYKDL